jgi:predicted aconitase with swiveling domain
MPRSRAENVPDAWSMVILDLRDNDKATMPIIVNPTPLVTNAAVVS